MKLFNLIRAMLACAVLAGVAACGNQSPTSRTPAVGPTRVTPTPWALRGAATPTPGPRTAKGQPPAPPATVPGQRLVVGLVTGTVAGIDSRRHDAEIKSLQDEATRRGFDLKLEDAQGQQENQIRALHDFITQRVNVMLLEPVTDSGWEATLQEAQAAGIPVILLNGKLSPPNERLYETRIGPDWVKEGRLAGEQLAKLLGGKGNVVVLEGTPGAAATLGRLEGFRQILKDFPEFKIVRSLAGFYQGNPGRETMRAVLQDRTITVNGVFAHDDTIALGAIQAIEAAGKKPGVDIKIVSVGGGREAFQAMAAGKLNGTVESTPLIGPPVFNAIQMTLINVAQPNWTVVESRYIPMDQAAAELPNRF